MSKKKDEKVEEKEEPLDTSITYKVVEYRNRFEAYSISGRRKQNPRMSSLQTQR